MLRTNVIFILLSILVLLPLGGAQEVAPAVPLLIKMASRIPNTLGSEGFEA